MTFREFLNETDDKLIKKYEDKLKAVQNSYKDDKDENYILWAKSELKAVKKGGIDELKKFWKEYNIDGNTNDNAKKLKKYLNESANSDIKKSIDGLVSGAKQAFEIAITMYYDDIESGKIDVNKVIDEAMKRVAAEYKKYGVSDTDAKIFAKMGGALALKDGGLDVPESFLKQLHKEILSR